MEHFRSNKFPDSGPVPWLDRPDAQQRIQAKLDAGILSPQEADLCRLWVAQGYLILSQVIEDQELDRIWQAYQAAVDSGVVPLQPEKAGEEDAYPGRYLNPHFLVPELKEVLHHPTLLRWAEILTERKPIPFQTIVSHKGSQQAVHSDAIHMTTYPHGYLTASWLAFEDIHPESGPLIYYPGSHRLPYLLSQDVNIPMGPQTECYDGYYQQYEPAIAALIQGKQLQPAYFHAKKGDVLFWHHNLLHGGSRRQDLQFSRRAIVCHYYSEGAFSYYDIVGMKAGFYEKPETVQK
ncbi:MAG TPA: phytanoyl-CoA dioxygenase family protein [Thermosynechococcaceae cyanobacterium]